MSICLALFDDRSPLGVLLVAPIDVIPAQQRITACESLFKEVCVFGILGLTDRHLEHLPVRNRDRATTGGPTTARLCALRNPPKNTWHRFQPKAAGRLIRFLVRARHRLATFHEVLVGHRLMERDELNPACRE